MFCFCFFPQQSLFPRLLAVPHWGPRRSLQGSRDPRWGNRPRKTPKPPRCGRNSGRSDGRNGDKRDSLLGSRGSRRHAFELCCLLLSLALFLCYFDSLLARLRNLSFFLLAFTYASISSSLGIHTQGWSGLLVLSKFLSMILHMMDFRALLSVSG